MWKKGKTGERNAVQYCKNNYVLQNVKPIDPLDNENWEVKGACH